MRSVGLLLALLFLTAACGAATRASPIRVTSTAWNHPMGVTAGQNRSIVVRGAQSASPSGKRPRMERTPAYVLDYCRKSPRLRRACPRLLPRMSQPSPHWDASLCLAGRPACAGLAWDDLSLVDAGYGTHPPAWSHVVLQAGDLAHAFPFRYPTRGRGINHLDGLFARKRTRAIYIGTFTWGTRRGTVVLAPDFPAGGEQGNHLIFRWRKDGTAFALGLHGWEPLSQAFATLRRMAIGI